jgi:pentatricopeptide repeat protein
MPIHNTLSWGAIISGYVQHGYGFPALELFQEMQEKCVKPNKVTFLCVLKACSSIRLAVHGRWVHSQIICEDCECDPAIANTLVDMYAKCGSLHESHKVFCAIKDPDVVSWAAMITGYAQHGRLDLAMECLQVMCCGGVVPNNAIFASLLAACSHFGVIQDGCQVFQNLREDHCMMPGFEQYSCMIDLFGRGGHLSKAEDVLRTMPSLPNFIATMSFLTHCHNFSGRETDKVK